MRSLFEAFLKEIDREWLLESTRCLMAIERGQTFADYHKAAGFAAELLENAGIDHVEIINFPADGKTAYLDHVMPLAWNATNGRLTVLKSPLPFEYPVIADFSRDPFHLIKGSVSTPEGGLRARIITESQLFGGEDAAGCLVITEPFTWPRADILSAALDLGAIGIITDFLGERSRYDTPDAVSWTTACTEGNNWHVNAGDRPFIGFSVTPRVGDRLRAAAARGDLLAEVESDGVRSEGELPLVTALLPGRRKEELWILSHLYEPLADDNSSGVVASIEMARIIRRLVENGRIPPLEFSLRLVFGMECYGFAAYAESLGGNLRDKVIGAINTDGLPLTADANFRIHLAPPGTPFFGNFQMTRLAEAYQGEINPAVNVVVDKGMYADDTFLSDSTTGIPTLWPIGTGKLWHNSEQTMKIIKPENFSRITAFVGAWAAAVVSLGEDALPDALASASVIARKLLLDEAGKIRRCIASGSFREGMDPVAEIRERMLYQLNIVRERIEDFRRVADLAAIGDEANGVDSFAGELIVRLQDELGKTMPAIAAGKVPKWFEYAATIVPSRARRGFPHCQADVPKSERRTLPDNVIYGAFARILANMDGRKSLQRLLREAEWETGTAFSEPQIKKYVTAVSFLSDHGYLRTTFNSTLTVDKIAAALKELGVEQDDLLFVHSGLSPFGRIEGGADAVIDAILSAIGEQGTALFPTFARSFIYFDGTTAKCGRFRPYDKNDPGQVWVGNIPQSVLKRKGVVRSAHPTHSVAGFGPLAEACLATHRETDPPTCRNSAFGKLLEFKGKILYFGSGLAPTTFLHFLEDETDMPYLANAVCRIKNPDGSSRTVMIPKHLPGHRDFYTKKAENCKFFRKVVAAGLEIRSVPLGLGQLQLIDASQLYELGIAAIKEEPDIFLCDNSQCGFCSKYKSVREGLDPF